MTRMVQLCAVAGFTVIVISCGGTTEAETGSRFLAACGSSCASGLTCVCGVCTEPCGTDSVCSKFPGQATCESTASVCSSEVIAACDVRCSSNTECATFGSTFICADGRCRLSLSPDAGGGACGDPGQACCDPFPSDGPNFCHGSFVCGPDNACVDCDCARGAYIPVCGVDGQTYDATCGRACVRAAIACNGECPCQCLGASGTGCGSVAPGTGQACCTGLQCCEGVPYDPAGECQSRCELRSDRNSKTNIRPANTRALLESVAALPISSWSYRSEPDVRHVGPMAQDFAAGFGLGDNDRVIAAVDASGVALASIQALYERVEKLSRDNEALEQRIRDLESRTH